MTEIKKIGVFNGLSCGMPVKEAIVLLGEDYDTFKRQPTDRATIYAYDDQLIHLTVNESGSVDVISIFQPRAVQVKGVLLLGRSVDEVLRELRENKLIFEEQGGGYYIKAFKILLIEVDEVIDGLEIYP